jgi:hypothetical protein
MVLAATLAACGGARAGDAGVAPALPVGDAIQAEPGDAAIADDGLQAAPDPAAVATGQASVSPDATVATGAVAAPGASPQPGIATGEAEQLLRELDALLGQIDVSLAEDDAATTTMGE